MENHNPLLSRKFLLAVLLVILASVLVFTAKITFDQFNALIAPVVGFYFAANIAGQVTAALSKKTDTDTETETI